MKNWKPIETAPKDGTFILIYEDRSEWGECSQMVTHWAKSRDGFGDEVEGWLDPDVGELGPTTINPTHWKSLDPNPIMRKKK